MRQESAFRWCLLLAAAAVCAGLAVRSAAQVEATAIPLTRGQLWETVNVAKMGPVFQNWARKGYGMDWPGFDPELIPRQVGGGTSHHVGGGFWAGGLRPSTRDSVWGVADWAMFATSVGLSPTDSPYLLLRHRLRWPNGENYWLRTDPGEAEEVIDTAWEFNPQYRFPYRPPRFLPVRVKRTVRCWSGSAKDEKYIIIEYVITNIAREGHIFDPQVASPEVYRMLAQDSVVQDLYVLFTYAFSINARGWTMLFPQLPPGALNNRFLYDARQRMVYGWADDYTQAPGNEKFDPYVYGSGGPRGGKEWLAPAFAGIKFLYVSPNKRGQVNAINQVGWSVSEPAHAFPFTGLETNEQWYSAMRDLRNTYQAILFPQGLADERWGRSRMWTMVSLGPWDLGPGDSLRVVMAELVGSVSSEVVFDPATTEQDIAKASLADLNATAQRAQFNFDHQYNVPDPPAAPEHIELARLTGTRVGNIIRWDAAGELLPDQDYSGQEAYDVAGYRIYRSDYLPIGPWQRIAEVQISDPRYFDPISHTYTFVDSQVVVGFGYYYAVSAFDTGHDHWPPDLTAVFPETNSNRVPVLESSFYPNHTTTPFVATFSAVNTTLDQVLVVPNPFVMRSGFITPGAQDVISFMNIPSPCTIRIYTIRGDLVATIEHTEDTGIAQWDQVTDFGQFAESGCYIYHLTSHAQATRGATRIGKFCVVR
ncbi:MAG: hypothetical protein ONB07_01910 [candidate division KSB1 bacterium]|nr:hypothetical protein [candidate division KSB1 bacterium]MDZ7392079.1 hypothetical protein [candidate division KSB1 bacterium]MDZ7411946.1 hypothetical protein [candidate division KSB1 bacterium]